MKTYKGLLCSILATRMLLGQEAETPTIQTQPQASEDQSAQAAVIEYEKKIVASAISGESKEPSLDTTDTVNGEKSVENLESSSTESDPTDQSTFASAQKLFNEMWGVKDSKNPKDPKEKKEKGPTVISTKDSNPSISSAQIETTLPPNNLIPFIQERSYAQNVVAGSDVKLPPMPDTLLPMGRPKLVSVTPKAKPRVEPTENSPEMVYKKQMEQAEAIIENEKSLKELIPQEEPQVTVSPFLQWVKENQKSPEIAQEIKEQYKANETQHDATRANDVFLKIRFPYTGSQSSPPSGGAVIYSTPKK